MGEWLGTLGFAWSRLLLYPGGLSALLLAWLLSRLLLSRNERQAAHHDNAGPRAVGLAEVIGDISAFITPLLVMSLLPLPHTQFFAYTPDLPTTLALLEWPRLCVLALTGKRPPSSDPKRWHTLCAGYVLVLLASLVLAQTSGSLRLDVLTRALESPTPTDVLGRVTGALGWSIAVLPLLQADTLAMPLLSGFLDWGMRLRACGYMLLAALAWLPLIPAPFWGELLVLVGLVALMAGVVRGSSPLLWEHWQPILIVVGAGLVAFLCWDAYHSLHVRLR